MLISCYGELKLLLKLADFAKATSLVNQIRTRANNQKLMGRCRTFVLPNQTGLKVDNTVTAANYKVNQYPAIFAKPRLCTQSYPYGNET